MKERRNRDGRVRFESCRGGQYQIQKYCGSFFRAGTGNAVLFQICIVCLYRDTFLRKIPGTFFGTFFSEFQISNLFLSLILVQTFKSSALCTHLHRSSQTNDFLKDLKEVART